ncbi:hypothetical protein [Pseudonocardia sp.]|uniref:hypothetical protein n=1 Tax=Pseudonocardia sp. TaxID=60912 RepID=UPI002613887D|nr:hypothetical protein [Pseudonocardia sp.]MCW2721362.1 hypothetical protein [Pseudonocardia sp.]
MIVPATVACLRCPAPIPVDVAVTVQRSGTEVVIDAQVADLRAAVRRLVLLGD